MGGWVETIGGLGLPALDQFEHFLVAGGLEFSNTIGRALVSLLCSFKRSETLHIHRMALPIVQNRLQFIEDEFYIRVVARCFRRDVFIYDFCAPIPVPFSDAD